MNDASKTVLVTGASSGIGLATALLLLGKGYRVIGMGRDFSQLHFAEEKLTNNFEPVVQDFASLDALCETLDQVKKNLAGGLRGIVHCAGTGSMGYLEQMSANKIRESININLTAPMLISRSLLPELKKQTCGDLVFIGSEASLQGAQQGSVYCAAKFGIRGFAQSLRRECSKSGLRVSLINPGAVKTGFFDKLYFEPGDDPVNGLKPETVAETILMILQSSPETVFDEISMTPLKQVWTRKKPVSD